MVDRIEPRPIEPDEHAAVVELFTQEVWGDDSDEMIDHESERLANPRFHTLVLTSSEDEIIAAGQIKGELITKVAVDSEFRNRGYGSKVLAALELYASQKGLRRVELVAINDTRQYYERRGYTKHPPEPNDPRDYLHKEFED